MEDYIKILVYMILYGKGSTLLWSTLVQSCFRSLSLQYSWLFVNKTSLPLL